MSELVESDAVHGYLHRPDGDAVAALAFTHGAGGNVESRLLVALADELSKRGVAVLRYEKRTRLHAAKMDLANATVEDETIADVPVQVADDDVASVEFREESFDKVEGSLNKTGEEQIGKVDVPRWEAETLASRHNMGI